MLHLCHDSWDFGGGGGSGGGSSGSDSAGIMTRSRNGRGDWLITFKPNHVLQAV